MGGEAKRKAMELIKAEENLANAGEIKLSPKDAMVVFFLDDACHTLRYKSAQLAESLGNPEAANEVIGAHNHLQKYRSLFLARASQKIVLASPADMPKAG